MRDYREYAGRTVSVMTTGGSFVGELVKVGRSTLTLKVDRAFFDDGQPSPVPAGVLLIERPVIQFVQVR